MQKFSKVQIILLPRFLKAYSGDILTTPIGWIWMCRHQWTVPVLDGTPATAMVFHPGSSNVLIVSSAANQIHVLDVEMRAPGGWSKRNGMRIAKKLLEFPGGISGLSLPISPESTSLIAYSSRYVPFFS